MKPRVVLFHCEDSVRILLTAILKNKGYDVRSFSEPESCSLYLGRDAYCSFGLPEAEALILYDRLPRMSGLVFLRVLTETGCVDHYPNRAVMAPVWSRKDLVMAKELHCRAIPMSSAVEEIIRWLEEIEREEQGGVVRKFPCCPLFSEEAGWPTGVA